MLFIALAARRLHVFRICFLWETGSNLQIEKKIEIELQMME